MLQFRSTGLIQPGRIDLYNLRIDVSKQSVYGITSGRKEERVANESRFSDALVDVLARNRNLFLRAEDIAYEIAKSVREVLKQQPLFGPITETHKFGKFVFIREDSTGPSDLPGSTQTGDPPVVAEATKESVLPNTEFLSDNDVLTMMMKQNYHDKLRNKSGTGIRHNYEVIERDSIIIDKATGLTWQQFGSQQSMTFQKSKVYVDRLNRTRFAGFDGWRLPTLEEAMSLMEPEQLHGELYIQPVFDKKQAQIWTMNLNSPSRIWAVSFDIGYCFRANSDSDNYVRAVRSGRAN